MDVKKITSNSNSTQLKITSTVPFNGAVSIGNYAQQRAQKVSDVLKEAMPSYIKLMEKMRCLKGEAGGIIINALGTGLVAPLFIAFNPLSKADEDTKKYTAMRQPVSAVLAILIQAGLTKPLGKLYDYLINNGKLGKSPYFDKSNLKGKDFYLKEHKKLNITDISSEDFAKGKEQEEIKKIIKSLETEGSIKFENGKKLEGKDVNNLINKTLESYKQSYQDKIKVIDEKQIDIKIKRAKLLINPNNTPEIKKMCDTINKMVKGDNANETLKDWLNSQNKDIKQLAQEFLACGNDVAMKHRANNTLLKINQFQSGVASINKISDEASNILPKMNLALKADENNIKIIMDEISRTYKGKENTHLIEKFVNEINSCPDEKTKKDYISKIINRIEEVLKNKGKTDEIIEIYQKAYYKDLSDTLKNKLIFLDNCKISTAAPISDIPNRINELKKTIKDFNGKDLSDDIVKTWQKIVDKRVKGYKQVTNILVGLFITLPITCSALNWVYPRFMDIFFPHLSKNDKSEAPEEKAKLKAKGGK